jgi:exodeoxyribonuclease VII large subunit
VSGGPEEIVVSVAELDRRLKRVVEGLSGGLWVEGELTSLKRASSGHVYFTLKDEEEEAIIDCVMYRFDALRASRHLSEGARVQLFGRTTLWAPRGRLQFVGQRMRPAGRGALLLALLALKRKLAAEGLFESDRKRKLPEEPKVIGVVTSRAGAAFHDIRTVAFRRGRVRLVLAPALVQGEGAPESLVVAIERLQRYPGLDVVIIGRGGGSGDDLMAFNDERVVRCIASCRVPVVSAIGHETDVSLADLAADVRAATPSQAAELAVPDSEARRRAIRVVETALARAMRRRLHGARALVDRRRAKLSDPRFLIAARQQELDELEARLRRRLDRTVHRGNQAVGGLMGRLLSRHPRAVIAHNRGNLLPLTERLRSAMALGLGRRRAALSLCAGRLGTLSPLSVLARGYAIALDASGHALRRAEASRTGDRVRIVLHEGALMATVDSVEIEPEGSR